jgi:hypothetical protein
MGSGWSGLKRVQLRGHAGVCGLQSSELSLQLQELGLELSQSRIVLLGRSSISSLSGHFITLLSSLSASNGRNLDGSIAVLGGNQWWLTWWSILGLCSSWMESESSGSTNLSVEIP